jgi:hypothetical protein
MRAAPSASGAIAEAAAATHAPPSKKPAAQAEMTTTNLILENSRGVAAFLDRNVATCEIVDRLPAGRGLPRVRVAPATA